MFHPFSGGNVKCHSTKKCHSEVLRSTFWGGKVHDGSNEPGYINA